MENGIELHFLTRSGRPKGCLDFSPAKNVFLRRAQYALLDDEERRTRIASSMIQGKVKNQLRLMERHDATDELVKTCKSVLNGLEHCDSLKAVRGLEGEAARAYFSHFPGHLPAWTGFSGRNTRPPRDPVKSVLSFLYTLLNQKIDSFIVHEGLDPAVGVLHELSYGRASLSCDMVEEFRVALADTIAFSMFNRKQLGLEDFYIADGCVRLGKDALTKVIGAFGKKLHEVVTYPPSGLRIPYWKVMKEQIHLLRRVIEGEKETYVPVYFR